jgi:hypothetical protein
MFCFSEARRDEGRYVVSGCMVAFDGDLKDIHVAVGLLFASFLGNLAIMNHHGDQKTARLSMRGL